MILFIPFLKLIFSENANEILAETSKPSLSNSPDIFSYFADYYNYLMAEFIKSYDEGGALLFICISVLTAFLLKNIFRYGAIYFQSYMRMAVVRDMRAHLFQQSTSLPLSFFSEEKKGDLLSRMTNDLNEIEISVVFALELIFREPLSIALLLGSMFYISPELTLFALILMPITALIISRIGKSLKRTSAKGQSQMGQLLSTIEESIGGIRIIKAFSAENTVKKKFDDQNHHHQKLITRAFRKRDLSSPLSEFLGASVMICLVWFGGKIVLENSTSSPLKGEEFLAYIVIFSQLLRPISGISNGMTAMSKATASLDRINAILGVKNHIQDPENPVEKPELSEGIKFENVTFSYGEENVLTNVSFELKKGKTVALVGESGSGKSTISDLIPRFHDVGSGAVKIDNIDIRQLRKVDLRSLISVVSQESILFNDSIRNNIAFGKPDATDEEIIHAAKVANAHDFIMATENGYETNVGDRGSKLSGGQRQRISIARAVLANTPIMILDEATSALDTESEKLVQDALDRLMENRTSLVIAHRLSTIRHADKIVVLKKGEIVEEGTHEELIAKNGYYKSLCEIQQVI